MKHREATSIAAPLDGVKLLAQCLDELLYEYSPSSYKPRVMSLLGLCEEALMLITQIDSGLIDRGRIQSVLDEITYVVRSDPVAKSLLDFDVDYYVAFAKECAPSDLKVRLGLFFNKVSGRKYIWALQSKLIDLCQDDRQKKLIYQTARRWISALNSTGYSRQHIRQKADVVFHADEVVVREVGDLRLLFESFSFVRQEFEAIFSATSMIAEIDGVAKRFGASSLSNESPLLAIAHEKGLECEEGETLVQVKGISALDVYAARGSAEKCLEHISDLFVLFHHKRKIRWRAEALVRSAGVDWVLVVPPNPSVKRSRDNIPNRAAKKLDAAFSNLSFTDEDSVSRFVSVVRLHGAALESVSTEAQLVNLWTAMEVLVHRESESKLSAVIRLLTPFLVHGYLDRLLYTLAGDIYRWNRSELYQATKIAELKGWKMHHRLAAVLLGGPYEDRRNRLYQAVQDFKLLRHRMFAVSDLICSTKRLKEALDEHERRVVWQIRRVYRGRNLIVHDGSTAAHIDALTENAHDYLDIFISRFFMLCADLKIVTTLEEAVAFQAKLYEQWRKTVYDQPAVTIENLRVVLGLGL